MKAGDLMPKIDRLLVLSLVALLGSVYAAPQNTSSYAKENVLYLMALQASIIEMEKQWGYIDDSFGSRERTDYKHMIVVSNPEITDGLPTQFEGHQIEYLIDQALIDKYKRTGKEFSVLEVHPVHTDGSFLRIEISLSWFSSREGRLEFALSDWSDVEFAFDCTNHAYIISSVKLGGI
jgi:hypothetical protein